MGTERTFPIGVHWRQQILRMVMTTPNGGFFVAFGWHHESANAIERIPIKDER